MAYITEGSERSMLTKSNLFYIPPTLTERVATHGTYIGPTAATFDDASDIPFEIAPSTDLISLADIRFECDLHVLRLENGQAFDDTANPCPINNILGSLFQSAVVEWLDDQSAIRLTYTLYGAIWQIYLGTRAKPCYLSSAQQDLCWIPRKITQILEPHT